MYDIIVLAFQTDMTRVATFSTGNEGQGPAVPEIGVKQDRHSLSHHNGNPKLMQDLLDSDAFNIKQFSYFLDRLSEVKDADGPLLDTTMALYGSGMAYGHSHGNASLPIILAGGTQLGLKHGKHVDFNLVEGLQGLRQAHGHLPQPGQQQGPPEQPAADDGPEDGREDREVRRQQRHDLGGAGVRHAIRLFGCIVALGACAITFFAFAQEKKAPPTPAASHQRKRLRKHRSSSRPTRGSTSPANWCSSMESIAAGRCGSTATGPMHYFAMLPLRHGWLQRRTRGTARRAARHAHARLLPPATRGRGRHHPAAPASESRTTTPSRSKTTSAITSVAGRRGRSSPLI